MNNLSITFFLVLLFLVINLIVGLIAGKNVKTIEDYAIGKKKWSTSALVMTFLATTFDFGALFRESIAFSKIGIIPFVHFIGIFISHLIRAIFLSNQISRFNGCLSIGDFTNKLYGNRARILVGIFASVYSCLVTALQIKGFSFIFSEFIGIDSLYSTILSGIILSIYTAIGGMRSVVATDILQFLMIGLTLAIIISFSIFKAGGIFNISSNIPKNIFSFSLNSDTSIFWALFFLESIFSYELAEPARFQRVLMSKNSSSFKKLFVYGGLSYFLLFFLIFVSSLTIYSFLGQNIQNINPISYIIHALPVYLKPIVFVGLIAIIMSSGDSWLHSAGISFSRDFIEPVLKKKITLLYTKIGVFFLGLFSIVLAFTAEKIFLNLGNLLSVIAPIVSVPVFLGFLGMKTSPKMFWASTFASVFTFLFSKIFLEKYSSFSIIYSCTASLVAFIFVHLRENKKIEMVGNPIFGTFFKFKKLKENTSFFKNEKNMNFENSKYVLFGSFYILITLLPYFLLFKENPKFKNEILYIRTIACVLCCFLITKSIWPKVFKRYFYLIWYPIVTYCLPFLSFSLVLINNASLESQVSFFVSLFLIFILVEGFSSFFVLIFGIIFSIIYSSQYLNLDSESLSNKTIALLTIQSILYSIFAFVFCRKKDKNTDLLTSKNRFLEFIQKNIILNSQKSMSLPKREESQFNLKIAIPSAKEKLSQIIEKLENKDSLEKDLKDLYESILSEDRTKIYYTLSAKKYDLSYLAFQAEEVLKIAGVESFSINNFSEKKNIVCDQSSILKMIYKISNDYCKKTIFENFTQDTNLVLSFFDTKIFYESEDENEKNNFFHKTIDGICIVISEKDIYEKNNIIKKIYSKKLTDIESIAPYNERESDVNFIDIEKEIDAHYGILENHSDENYICWVCVIPSNLYHIRPETLDLCEPINAVYNFPEAIELEKNFFKKIENFKDVNFEKISYALSIIKKYHFHQTRKSGEPYYMHPINVAILVLDIIDDETVTIHETLEKNRENIIIASLLHDILEDTSYSKKAIFKNFGMKVTELILEVTKINSSKRVAILSNDQAFNLMQKYPISFCIKIADRFHNLLTMDGHSSVDKRKQIAKETLYFFIIPAKKYNINTIANKMQSMCDYIIKNGKIEGFQN